MRENEKRKEGKEDNDVFSALCSCVCVCVAVVTFSVGNEDSEDTSQAGKHRSSFASQ